MNNRVKYVAALVGLCVVAGFLAAALGLGGGGISSKQKRMIDSAGPAYHDCLVGTGQRCEEAYALRNKLRSQGLCPDGPEGQDVDSYGGWYRCVPD